MKFILCEKFILEETPSKSLKESTILTEEENLDLEAEYADLLGINKAETADTQDLEADLLGISEKDKATLNTSWGEGWGNLYKACLKSKNIPEATEKFWNGGLPVENKAIDKENLNKNFPLVSEKESKGYFIGEWGETDSKIVRNIQAALKEEIDSFGWDEKTNPFIYYLKVLQQTKKLQSLTKDVYHHLHNAFIDKKLTKDDIFGKGVFKNSNLIFTDAFLTLSAGGADYLDNQNWLAKNYKSLGIKNLSAVTALLNIFDTSGDLQNIGATPKVTTITTLRSLDEIKAFTKTENDGDNDNINDTKETATNEDIKDLIILHKSDSKEVLAYLTLQYRKQDWFKKLDSNLVAKLRKNQASVAVPFEKLDQYDKEFNKKFTAKQLQILITKLAENI